MRALSFHSLRHSFEAPAHTKTTGAPKVISNARTSAGTIACAESAGLKTRPLIALFSRRFHSPESEISDRRSKGVIRIVPGGSPSGQRDWHKECPPRHAREHLRPLGRSSPSQVRRDAPPTVQPIASSLPGARFFLLQSRVEPHLDPPGSETNMEMADRPGSSRIVRKAGAPRIAEATIAVAQRTEFTRICDCFMGKELVQEFKRPPRAVQVTDLERACSKAKFATYDCGGGPRAGHGRRHSRCSARSRATSRGP